MHHEPNNCMFLGNKAILYMLRFTITAQNVAMMRPSNIRQNCFAYPPPPRYVKTSITHYKEGGGGECKIFVRVFAFLR